MRASPVPKDYAVIQIRPMIHQGVISREKVDSQNRELGWQMKVGNKLHT